MRGWIQPRPKAKFHFLDGSNTLCWRWWIGGYIKPVATVEQSAACNRCWRRQEWRLAHRFGWKAAMGL